MQAEKAVEKSLMTVNHLILHTKYESYIMNNNKAIRK
jgi:hypothetical protein